MHFVVERNYTDESYVKKEKANFRIKQETKTKTKYLKEQKYIYDIDPSGKEPQNNKKKKKRYENKRKNIRIFSHQR